MGAVIFDAGVVIGLFDAQDVHHQDAHQALQAARLGDQPILLPASALSEILIGAARLGERAFQIGRDRTMAAVDGVPPVDSAVALAAARLRADHRSLRLPDALVIATGQALDADAVVTADRSWSHYDRRVQVIG